MTKTITNIYIEGPGEVVLFCALIKQHFNKEFKISKSKLRATFEDDTNTFHIRVFDNQVESGGIDSEKIRKAMTEIQSSEQLGENNYVIIDADTTQHKPAGGAKARKKYLEDRKKEYGLSFDFFLIPDDKTDGNLEGVMNQIIGSKGQPFYSCLSSYVNCLKTLQTNLPVGLEGKDLEKQKFDWYTFLMLGQSSSKATAATKRDYTKDIWNLNSKGIQPLLQFLGKIFQNTTPN